MRYEGQEYTLNVPVQPDGVEDSAFLSDIADAFHGAHEVRYGHSNSGAPVEIVAVRLAVLGDLGKAPPTLQDDGRVAEDGQATREVVIGGERQRARIVPRGALAPRSSVTGPAVIEEPTATIVVPNGAVASVDPHGPLVIRLGGGR
jgi:N-methylhydantoinase A